MIVVMGKKKEYIHSKKTSAMDSSSKETMQSLRSWIQKLEQSTASVSSRLSAVESRLSRHFLTTGDGLIPIMEDAVCTEDGISENTCKDGCVKPLDLGFFYDGLRKQEQETQTLKNQLSDLASTIHPLQEDLREVHASLAGIRTQMELKILQLAQRKPLVMRLGAMEIPLEVTGIIGGLLAFTIAMLVWLNQKEVLLSPVFLSGIGILLIGSAVLKTVRLRSHKQRQYPIPVESPLAAPLHEEH